MAADSVGFRDWFLRRVVALGVALAIGTELLSLFGLVRVVPLLVWWVGVIAVVLVWGRRCGGLSVPRDPVVWGCLAGIGLIVGITGFDAGLSAPNSSDAMAYHLPRVVYWAEQGSVRFFPTAYLNQVMLQPFAEYAMLHGYVLTGGDRLVNFGQWFASIGSIVGVSLVAGEFGAGVRGQALAALFCSSLPSGILASSGAKNDYILAMWLLAAVYFALRFVRTLRGRDAWMLGAALGLALLTKVTAYLFAPWVLGAVFASGWSGKKWRLLGAGVLFPALALNAPQFVRNYGLSGSIMGFDSAQGDGFFRWRNETFGWKQTLSNVLRNASEQLGARSEGWNQGLYRMVLEAHQELGIDVNDPATTWRWSRFAAPTNSNHEASAPNRWHIVILLAASVMIFWRRDRARTWYAIALVCAFAGFCAYLKWQPYLSRLFLPLFVLGAPLTGVLGEVGRWRVLLQAALCVFLLDNARHPLFDNWVRPLRGPRSVWRVPREEQYFADMSQWGNAASYRKSVEALAAIDCHTVGIDITNLQLEYPLQALLRARKPGVQFLHAGVENVSKRYREPVSAPACAVVCLDCAGDEKRLGLYAGFGSRIVVERFVILH